MSNLEIFFELVKISVLFTIAISVSNNYLDGEKVATALLLAFSTLVILLLGWWGINYVF